MYPLPHMFAICVWVWGRKAQDLPSWQISSIQYIVANWSNYSHHAVH